MIDMKILKKFLKKREGWVDLTKEWVRDFNIPGVEPVNKEEE